VGDSHWSSVLLKDCTQLEGLIVEQLMKDSVLWEGPNTGAGEEHEEEGAAEMKCGGLTSTPIPLHCLGGRA